MAPITKHARLTKPVLGIGLLIVLMASTLTWHHYNQSHVSFGGAGTFTGIVTADGCARNTPGSPPIGDVGCSIAVGNKTVQIVHGNILVKTWGRTYGFTTNQDITGRKVIVKADGQDNSYTLSSADDYVKLVN